MFWNAPGSSIPFRYAEDLDLWLRVLAIGGRIAYHCKPLFHYRRRGSNATADTRALRAGALEVLERLSQSVSLKAEDRAGLARAHRLHQAYSDYHEGKRRSWPAIASGPGIAFNLPTGTEAT